jgi:hypothetical protein
MIPASEAVAMTAPATPPGDQRHERPGAEDTPSTLTLMMRR